MDYRVLHVLDHSWPLLSGYSVRSRNIVNAQKGAGFQPTVLTGPLHQVDDKDAADTEVDGVRYLRTPLTGIPAALLQRRTPVLREAAVVRLLRNRIVELAGNGNFDIIHAHSPALCGLAAAQAAKKVGIPFVYEIRAFWEDGAVDQNRQTSQSMRYRLGRELETRVVRRADAVVGIAEHIVNDVRARGVDSSKLFHVPNGVDANRFVPRPRDDAFAAELGLGNDPVFGFAGSLYRFEGVSWMVRAAAELHRRGNAFHLLILGEGEDRADIDAAVRETDSSAYIHVLGKVPHDQMQRYYSVMDILVYPRRKTRLTDLVTPLKPLEAMAQCKAVMASDLPALRELVTPEETGLVFTWDSTDDFCRQAERLLQNLSFRARLGEQARAKVLKEKNWPVLVRRYEDVYKAASGRVGEYEATVAL